MKRNMIQTADLVKGHIPDRYDLTAEDLQKLHEILHSGSRDSEFDALATAFRYGYVLGARAEKAGKNEIQA